MANYLMKHGGGWKYLRAIPKDLRLLIGKKNATRYLGALSHSEACSKARAQAVKHDELFSLLRSLPKAQQDEIVLAGGLALWKDQATQDGVPLTFLEAAAHVGHQELYDEEADGAFRAKQVLNTLEARTAYELAVRERESTVRLLSKLDPSTAPKSRQLDDLIVIYEREKPSLSQKTRDRTKLYLSRFAETVGDMRPSQVTRTQVVAFRDALEARKLSSANVNQHLDKIAALFNVAMSAGAVESNPAYKIKARQRTRIIESEQKGFAESEVNKIFEALPAQSQDFQWIVRLCAYHGMRSQEAVQLRVDDVLKIHGVHVLSVHGRHGSIKNASSVRDIPVHPKCKGIVAYAADVAKQYGPSAWLLQSFKGQDRAREFQNQAGIWLRKELGLNGKRHHEFRHRFRTLCREVEMPEAISRALMGHTLGKGEHGAYGAPPSLKQRAKWIAKIDPLKG